MSHPSPRISVITPSLNRGAYLERTLCSVLDQGYSHKEHWVVDGGSHDGSLDILLNYHEELTGWTSRVDQGPADAVNAALTCATGDIVVILPADHLLLPGSLEVVARNMGAHDGPDWLIGGTVRIGAHDQFEGHARPSMPRSLAAFLQHDSGLLPAAASFFRASLFKTHGRLDADLRRAYDYEFACRLLASGLRPRIVPESLVAARQKPRPLAPRDTIDHGLEYIAVARRYAEQLPILQRYALWRNCDLRERIYTLAQAELRGNASRAYLWNELLRHPWWLADGTFRRVLRHGQPDFSVATGTLDAAA